MSAPPGEWTENEILEDTKIAIAFFRDTRTSEPLEAWVEEVEKRKEEFTKLINNHGIANPNNFSVENLPAIIEDGLFDALRYLSGPPISTDDLKTIAELTSVSPNRLLANPLEAQRLFDIILKNIDPYRFPWLVKNRQSSKDEQNNAILASALLHASQKLQSSRRNNAKNEQESAVRDELKRIGFVGKKISRKINSYKDFPSRGIVSENEINLGGNQADVVARLWDDKILLIECKVSNSAVNSYKRLKNDTISKKTNWNKDFGESNIVTSAVLAGVFSPSLVIEAQKSGLMIFWSHRIEDLSRFIESTRN